ncbi:MAG: T9SS type A sorting domain-containing protein [Flavobacteriales bacterium]|nr:MAG: T9SS type A sorting domain-containing protein [Flavobacteriales bacterium]
MMARFLAAALTILMSMYGHGQLVISEACSKNLDLIQDPFGDTPDWIELHNQGTEAVELTGLFLSDDRFHPDQWSLPNQTLEAGGYLVLFHGLDNSDGMHFPFKLDAAGEEIVLSSSAFAPVDVFPLPALRPNHSAARDGSGTIRIHDQPTPGQPNTSPGYPGYAPVPHFSTPPGVKPGPLPVGLTVAPDCTVHMTWDGSEPTSSSAIYTGAIQLTSTTVLKAFARRPGHLDSPTIAGTFLLNEQTRLPVVSLSMDPDSMFDDTLGLYMLGPEADTVYPHWGANFWDERGIGVRFEYFDELGVRRIDQDVELRIHGGRSSRNKPQRPLRLTARDHFGSDGIGHGFFPEKPALETFKRIILRNSGSDWCQAHYRDGFFHQVALHAGLDIDVLGFKPSVVYINGNYWGIHNIRERVDKDYLATNHSMDPDALLIMDEENHVIQGDSLHFDSLQQFIRSHDMSDDLHFARVDSLMDLKSFIDYFALEMFAGNSDWPSNNLKYWKPSIHRGKWRYLMYDLDATMNAAPWIPNDFDMFYWVHVHREGFIHAEIYQSLIQRPEFRRSFLNRLADLMNTCLKADALMAENDRIRATIAHEIPRHFQRWGTNPSIWHEQSGQVIPEWIRLRAGYMREDVLAWYDLPNTAQLRFDMFPRGAGTMQVNTIQPTMPFDGVYFNGNDIDVQVTPLPGFRFSHWSYSGEPDSLFTSTHLRRSFATDGTLTAHFAKESTRIHVFPNPAGDRAELSFEAPRPGTVEISIWDVQGRMLDRWSISGSQGVNRIPIDLTLEHAGIMEVRVIHDGNVYTTRVQKH